MNTGVELLVLLGICKHQRALLRLDLVSLFISPEYPFLRQS